jgi:hypothetical protein
MGFLRVLVALADVFAALVERGAGPLWDRRRPRQLDAPEERRMGQYETTRSPLSRGSEKAAESEGLLTPLAATHGAQHSALAVWRT